MTHMHHLKPKHLGGLDCKSNLLEVTVEEHALIHEARWYAYSQLEDYTAWKGLIGLIGKERKFYRKYPKRPSHRRGDWLDHRKLLNGKGTPWN